MESVHGFDFFPLQFDAEGTLTSTGEWNAFKDRVRNVQATDALFIAHGFRNDEGEARALYGEFLRTFRQNMGRAEIREKFESRRFTVAGVLWPSKAFREAFGSDGGGVQAAGDEAAELEAARQQLDDLKCTDGLSATQRSSLEQASALLPRLQGRPDLQDEFADLVLSIVSDAGDPAEGLHQIKARPGSELFDKLAVPVILPTERHGDADGGVAAVGAGGVTGDGGTQGVGSLFGSIFGRVGQFLNLTTWYLMKERSGTVGFKGVAPLVRELRAASPTAKIHLVGHSLGGRLVAACAKALAEPPVVKINSLVLLQAAFSHFGLSADNKAGTPGFFRPVIDKKVVTGPMVATFSFQDSVVGKAYAIASRLAGDNVKAIGDRNDPFGGIGRNGAVNLTEHSEDRLHPAGRAYAFTPGVLFCLDGSGGPIADHGDVKNENVTYAAASAVAHT